jgi:hypothetical protein
LTSRLSQASPPLSPKSQHSSEQSLCPHHHRIQPYRTIVSIAQSIKATTIPSHLNPPANMPPKRKASASSLLPATPSDAPLETGPATTMDNSPLPPKKTRRASKAPLETSAEDSKPLPSAPDTLVSGSATETQGIADAAPAPKKTAGRKRKAATAAAPDDETADPAAKRKRAAAAPKKTAVKKQKKTAAKTPTIVIEDVDSEYEKLESQLLQPLAGAVRHKLRAVDEFLDANTTPALQREDASCNIAIVDELDLLAALVILRVDFQLDLPCTGVSLDDAGEMFVERLGAGKVSVDFDKTCEAERTVHEKLARREMGLEDVNLVEVEIEMLLAKRKQLADDGEPAAEFRVYEEPERDEEVAS